ncbi:hypothetical protein C0J29_31690 (plasmid) [Mycobacterium paragordonae]|uniref:Uncharacterized protein n=1 Tax=Mycobacterium paragordonae TaxID=1389713 RepID=A0ABQ1CFZ9_9MYCO|nr:MULTISPECIES: hypothetical protein [Mycobacterium]AYE99530.1 hypothetical protein C0J29_31690 [Mycobacterium paragordonae]QNI09776.1 hypothetical protein GAN17_25635 [Mycobacterium kubicae]GFG83257.1 hypothetical protein MPRG_65330 [Mycobacterium paragordonae]
MLSDPAASAWIAAGRPVPTAPRSAQGLCGRCGSDEPTVPSNAIVSDKFTGYDAWPYGLHRLCPPCAWAYSRAPNTQPALHITAMSVTEHRDTAGLLPRLTAGPLSEHDAVVVPGSRRQHILPAAAWKHLATDDGVVHPWNAASAHRLGELAWLRTTIPDISWQALTRPVPHPRHLRARSREHRARILDSWQQLAPWRALPPLWTAARRLTNTELHTGVG